MEGIVFAVAAVAALSVLAGKLAYRNIRETSVPLFLNSKLAPIFVGLIVIEYGHASTINLDVPSWFLTMAGLVVMSGAVNHKLRPLSLVAATFSEFGLALSLLLTGSSLNIPQTQIHLAVAMHFAIFFLYLTAHMNAEILLTIKAREGEFRDRVP